MNGVRVRSLNGANLTLAFPDELNRSFVEKPKRLEVVKKALTDELGVSGLAIRCELAVPGEDEPPAQEVPTELDFEAEPTSTAQAVVSNGSSLVVSDGDDGSDEPGILSIVETEFGDRLLDV